MPSFWSSDVCSRSEEHTSELQSLTNLVCRLLLEKKQNVGEAIDFDHWLYLGETPIFYFPTYLFAVKTLQPKSSCSASNSGTFFFLMAEGAPEVFHFFLPNAFPD